MITPLLSICIPTYNRAHYLKDCLQSIALQVQDDPSLKNHLEVVIADNASTDNTETVVQEFRDHFEHFVYKKNETNVGFDRNVDIAVHAAHGTYGWYLGDDDALVRGSLKHMMDVCEHNTYAVISVADMPLETRPIPTIQPHVYTDADHITGLSPSESYLKGHLPSALSMLAFRIKDWLTAADFTHHTTGWYYFETILRIASKNGGVLYISKPMIYTGQDCRWADNGGGLQIFIDCQHFLRKMIDWGYDQDEVRDELSKNAQRFPLILLQAKASGLPTTLKNFSLVRTYAQQTPVHIRYVSYALFFIPNVIARLARTIKKQLV